MNSDVNYFNKLLLDNLSSILTDINSGTSSISCAFSGTLNDYFNKGKLFITRKNIIFEEKVINGHKQVINLDTPRDYIIIKVTLNGSAYKQEANGEVINEPLFSGQPEKEIKNKLIRLGDYIMSLYLGKTIEMPEEFTKKR